VAFPVLSQFRQNLGPNAAQVSSAANSTEKASIAWGVSPNTPPPFFPRICCALNFKTNNQV
jgi:hypothetical protein